MGVPTFPISVTGISDKNKKANHNDKEIFLPVEILYSAAWWPKELSKKHSTSMLFTLNAIQDDFGPYLCKWIESYELLEPAINLYFSVLYNPHIYAEVKFLSMAQAVETYHRRVFGGSFQDNDQYLANLYQQFRDGSEIA